MKKINILDKCLFFTANSLARVITKIADEEFGKLDFVPSHAFLVMVAVEQPGTSQKELAEQLNLTQSTISRFIDSLITRGYLRKSSDGKSRIVFGTDKAQIILPEIKKAWKAVHTRYSNILGVNEGQQLSDNINLAYKKLQGVTHD